MNNHFEDKGIYRVLLVSIINWESVLEIPALLNQGGCTVDLFCKKDAWVLQNKFYENSIIAQGNDHDFISHLLNYVVESGEKYDWIIPGDDITIRLLNKELQSVELFYKIMPLTKIENRAILGSKAGFSNLCNKYAVKTPRYLVYSTTQTPGSIGDYMGFPLLIKLDESEGGYGVFLCESEAALTSKLGEIKNKNGLVFQQFIKGHEVNTEALYKDGVLIVYSYSKPLKLMSNFGVSTQKLYSQNRDVETELIQIGHDIGINGFCNIAFMYNELDRSYYLIEVDIRPTAWMYYGKFIGNDFAKGVNKAIQNDLSLLAPDEKYGGKEIQIHLFRRDIYRCIQEKDYAGLWIWFTNKNYCWRYIPVYDTKYLRSCIKYLSRFFRVLLFEKAKRPFMQ